LHTWVLSCLATIAGGRMCTHAREIGTYDYSNAKHRNNKGSNG